MEGGIQKLIHEGIHEFAEYALPKDVKEDLATKVSSASFAKPSHASKSCQAHKLFLLTTQRQPVTCKMSDMCFLSVYKFMGHLLDATSVVSEFGLNIESLGYSIMIQTLIILSDKYQASDIHTRDMGVHIIMGMLETINCECSF